MVLQVLQVSQVLQVALRAALQVPLQVAQQEVVEEGQPVGRQGELKDVYRLVFVVVGQVLPEVHHHCPLQGLVVQLRPGLLTIQPGVLSKNNFI